MASGFNLACGCLNLNLLTVIKGQGQGNLSSRRQRLGELQQHDMQTARASRGPWPEW